MGYKRSRRYANYKGGKKYDKDQDFKLLERGLEANYQVHTIMHIDEKFLMTNDAQRPHVVVLDYKLNGVECIRAFREIRAKYPTCPSSP